MRRIERRFSIEINSRGYSFIVLEETEHLIDWGTRDLPKDVSVFLAKFKRDMERVRPDILVIEDPAGSLKGGRTLERLAWAEDWAREDGYTIESMFRRDFMQNLREYGSTKHDFAVALTRLFPELESRLPPPRKPWKSEAQRMGIFVALGRALITARGSSSAAKGQPCSR